MDRTKVLEKSNKHTIVIALEVLDNLSHDKIKVSHSTGDILQAEVRSKHTDSYDDQIDLEETFTPLSDDLLKQILSVQQSYLPSAASDYRASWVPTVTCGIINEIFDARPNSSLLFADFDWLPPPRLELRSIQTRRSIEGINEPLVTCMDDVDHLCYLDAPPFCDILFPTQFHDLQVYTENLLMDKHISSVVKIRKQNEFLSDYGQEEVDRTRGRFTGNTPLLSDFTNCSVITVSTS